MGNTAMATIKEIRSMIWDHEFDIVDSEAELGRRRFERARRAAIHRTLRTPKRSASPCEAMRRAPRDAGVVAAGIPNLSRHGAARLSQRGITMDQVVTVLDFGAEQRSHGATRYFLDHRARTRLEVEMPEALRSLRTLDIQVVMGDDGRLVTAAHRTKRIRREIQKIRTPVKN
jgi:hypothetical protein